MANTPRNSMHIFVEINKKNTITASLPTPPPTTVTVQIGFAPGRFRSVRAGQQQQLNTVAH